MCGLVGILGQHLTVTDEKIFQQMLIVDVLRGKHSTGITAATKNGTVGWIKDVGDAYSMVNSKDTQKWFTDTRNPVAYMGHNRAATLGAVNAANAHPFTDNHITLAHNGTLVTTKNLPNDANYEVDSEAVTHAVATLGINETVSRMVGAWALAYTDTEQGTINFCRNDERPLWFARLRSVYGQKKAVNKWVYASERDLLKWIVGRNGYEVVNFFQLKPCKLMTFDMKGDFDTFSVTDLEHTEDDAATQRAIAARTGYNGAYSKKSHSYNPQSHPWQRKNPITNGSGGPTNTTSTSTSHKTGGSDSTSPLPSNASQEKPKTTGNHFKIGTFEQGDSVPFWPVCFSLDNRYSYIKQEGAMGSVTGWMAEEPYAPVRLSCVKVGDVSALRWSTQHKMWMLPDGEYEADLISVVPSGKDGKLTQAILKSSTISRVVPFENSDTPMAMTTQAAGFYQPMFEDLESQEEFDDIPTGSNVIPFREALELVRGPHGIFIPVDTFKEKVANGCTNCDNPIHPSDADEVTWVEQDMPACPTCTDLYFQHHKQEAK